MQQTLLIPIGQVKHDGWLAGQWCRAVRLRWQPASVNDRHYRCVFVAKGIGMHGLIHPSIFRCAAFGISTWIFWKKILPLAECSA